MVPDPILIYHYLYVMIYTEEFEQWWKIFSILEKVSESEKRIAWCGWNARTEKMESQIQPSHCDRLRSERERCFR
jgi:hypothetical protein